MVKQDVPTMSYPVWLPPGGGVEPGEAAKEAVVREVKEETGLVLKPLRLRYIHEFISPPFHATELYFLANLLDGTLKTGHDPEHNSGEQLIRDVRFIAMSEASEYDLFPGFLKKEILGGSLQDDMISHFVTS